MYYCPSGVSFVADTPSWERVPVDEELCFIGKKSWLRRHTIWSVQDMVSAIREDRHPELGGLNALTSLECVSAVYESHFTRSRVELPLQDRRHPLVKRL